MRLQVLTYDNINTNLPLGFTSMNIKSLFVIFFNILTHSSPALSCSLNLVPSKTHQLNIILKVSFENLFSECEQIYRKLGLVSFTKEIFNGKLHNLCMFLDDIISPNFTFLLSYKNLLYSQKSKKSLKISPFKLSILLPVTFLLLYFLLHHLVWNVVYRQFTNIISLDLSKIKIRKWEP